MFFDDKDNFDRSSVCYAEINKQSPNSSGALSVDCPAVASVTHPTAGYEAGSAFDDNLDTRWATPDGTTQATLEVDLGEVRAVQSLCLREYENRIKKFQIEYRTTNGGEWSKAYEGTTVGDSFKQSFPQVSGRYFRLHILDVTDAPSIYEFQLFDK